MPYPAHVAHVAGGALPGGEVWTCTLRTVPSTPPTFGGLDLVAAAEEVRALWQGCLAATAGFSVGSTLARVQSYVYDEAGILAEQAVSTGATYTGTVAVKMPNQCAVVVSLGTGQAGKSRRGRIFVPLLGLGMVDGRMASTSPGLIADAFQGMLESLAGAGYATPPSEGRVVVASATLGITTPVTNIRVGNVIDTQQRRRDAIVEAYTLRAIAA